MGKNRKKRQDHQTHGVVSFNELSKMISSAWAEADEETKAYCKMISNTELDKYRVEQEEFKEKYGEEAFEAQTLKRKNAELAKELAAKGIDRKEEKKRLKRAKLQEAAAKSREKSDAEMQNGDDRKAAANPEATTVQQSGTNNSGASLQDSTDGQILMRSALDRNIALQLMRAREERIRAMTATRGVLNNDDLLGMTSQDELLRAKLAMQGNVAAYQSSLLSPPREEQLLNRQTSLTTRDAQLREMLALQSERIHALTNNSALGGLSTQEDIQRSDPASRYDSAGSNEGIVTMLNSQRDRLQTMLAQNGRLRILATQGGTPTRNSIVRSSVLELNDDIDREMRLQAAISAHYDRLQPLQSAQEDRLNDGIDREMRLQAAISAHYDRLQPLQSAQDDRLLLSQLQENRLRNLTGLSGLGGSLAASLDTQSIYQPQILSQILPHIHEASAAVPAAASTQSRNIAAKSLIDRGLETNTASVTGLSQPDNAELETVSTQKNSELNRAEKSPSPSDKKSH